MDESPEVVFQRKLIDSAHWDGLVQVIVQYLSTIMDAESVILYVRHPGVLNFSYVAHWCEVSDWPADEIPKQLMSSCDRCLAATSYRQMKVGCCSMPSGLQVESSTVQFCVPLVFGNEMVAILQIYLPDDSELSSQQVEALTRVLPQVSLAIENFRLHYSLNMLTDEVEGSRQHLAQNLHDNLAHTIGYLRLKLDQLSMESASLENCETQAVIKRLRDAATEAYELIRCTLTELEPDGSSDLEETLLERANLIGEREGFKVQMTCFGEPIPVFPEVRRQVLYICREALNNVGRHANAQRADIRLNWATNHFTISITDDGIGFKQDELPPGDHFGLVIMKRRARSIAGSLTVCSSPGNGTQLLLCSPVGFSLATRAKSMRIESKRQ